MIRGLYLHHSLTDYDLALNNQPPSSEPPGIGSLGVHVKEVIATINRLEGLGLQRMEIPPPKCIVLGKLTHESTHFSSLTSNR